MISLFEAHSISKNIFSTRKFLSNRLCCPQFNPFLWQDKIIEWHDEKHIDDNVFDFFFMLFAFGSTMKKVESKQEDKSKVADRLLALEQKTTLKNDTIANVEKYDSICRRNNSFRCDEPKSVFFKGKYFSKVYEGKFKDSVDLYKDFENFAKTKGYKINKIYSWKPICKKCAKKYGVNYHVLIAHID